MDQDHDFQYENAYRLRARSYMCDFGYVRAYASFHLMCTHIHYHTTQYKTEPVSFAVLMQCIVPAIFLLCREHLVISRRYISLCAPRIIRIIHDLTVLNGCDFFNSSPAILTLTWLRLFPVANMWNYGFLILW